MPAQRAGTGQATCGPSKPGHELRPARRRPASAPGRSVRQVATAAQCALSPPPLTGRARCVPTSVAAVCQLLTGPKRRNPDKPRRDPAPASVPPGTPSRSYGAPATHGPARPAASQRIRPGCPSYSDRAPWRSVAATKVSTLPEPGITASRVRAPPQSDLAAPDVMVNGLTGERRETGHRPYARRRQIATIPQPDATAIAHRTSIRVRHRRPSQPTMTERRTALRAHSAGASATLGNQLAIAWPAAEMRRCALW
jgi:hypothetical protein